MTSFKPIILIGAARSGTKMLRDLIAEHPEVDCVPYDINYVWKMGNESFPCDELTPDLITEKVRQKIQRNLAGYHHGNPMLIEKTVSNCLRVDFIRELYPDAMYLHLVRDGRDVVESTYRQWNAKPDWGYIIKKARSFPIRDAFGYAIQYALRTIRNPRRRDGAKSHVWGPSYAGVADDLQEHDALYVCAKQWSRCVRMATDSLANVAEEQVLRVRYETFVESPIEHVQSIASWLDIDPSPIESHASRISTQNVGKGKSALSDEDMQRLSDVMINELREHGYV